MTEPRNDFLAALVFLGTFIIPEIDAAYIMPKVKESALKMQIQCHDEPDNCWIQKKEKK